MPSLNGKERELMTAICDAYKKCYPRDQNSMLDPKFEAGYRAALAVREEPQGERLRDGLGAVGCAYHDLTHHPDVLFVDCDEHLCIKVRALLQDTEQEPERQLQADPDSSKDLESGLWRCPECGHEDADVQRGVAAFCGDECCRRDEPTKLCKGCNGSGVDGEGTSAIPCPECSGRGKTTQ